MKAVAYLRVSTVRQAEKDLSIPDQRSQIEAFCQTKGWDLVAEYAELGVSATTDNRPQLQRLMADVRDGGFEVVVVHSFSRFFRDTFEFELYRRKLDKQGIRIISITQDLSDDPSGQMVRQVLTVFDEYQSKENAKHVLRAMKENARQGFWNGGPPPYGYVSVAAGIKGDAVKKRLEINPAEAEIVRLIFDLYSQGKGIRAIAAHLNAKKLTYRRGRAFTSGIIHHILRETAYAGTHYFNKRSLKTRKPKDRSEWVPLKTPIIVDPEVFDATQKRLAKNSPTRTPTRVVNGPTLLTGLAKCAFCGGGMTLRTGKSGKYAYYACNRRMTEGACRCQGRSIPMQRLDDLVLGQLETRLFTPQRMEKLLAALTQRATDKATNMAVKAKELRQAKRAVEQKIDRLHDAIADGLVTDSAAFRRNLSKYEQELEDILRQIAALDRQRDIPRHLLSQRNVIRFTDAVRAKLRDTDPAFRKAYVRQFVDRVEVADDEIRISGPKAALLAALASNDEAGTAMVPTSVTDWWAHKDSNLGPAD